MKPDANGSPRLMIHKENCPMLVKQLRTYRWRQGSESGRNPTDGPMQVLKKNDHAPDSLRYLVFSDANQVGITPEGLRKTRDYRRYGINTKMGDA